MEKLLVYVMGMVCSGKSVFLEQAVNQLSSVGLVEVGKEFRLRYPPDHFKGQASPEHTRKEALEIYHSETEGKLQVYDTVLVDGQPRSPDQVTGILNSFTSVSKLFVILEASHEIRLERIYARTRDKETGVRELSLQRMITDYRMMYDTLKALMYYDNRLNGYPFYSRVPIHFCNQVDPIAINHVLVAIQHRQGVFKVPKHAESYFPVAALEF